MLPMRTVIAARSVQPNLAGHVEVDGPHNDHFSRPHAGQQL